MVIGSAIPTGVTMVMGIVMGDMDTVTRDVVMPAGHMEAIPEHMRPHRMAVSTAPGNRVDHLQEQDQ